MRSEPQRLDLDDIATRAAIGRGLRLTIGTDAHNTLELGFMRWGVDQARRGWVTRRSVINTRSLAQLLRLLGRH